mgnify:CR=1 FL=1
MASGVVDKDPPDRLGGDREEMGPVVPLSPLLVHEFEVGLVHQGGCLQRMIAAFLSHLQLGRSPQLLVHQRQQLLGGLPVACGRTGRALGLTVCSVRRWGVPLLPAHHLSTSESLSGASSPP